MDLIATRSSTTARVIGVRNTAPGIAMSTTRDGGTWLRATGGLLATTA